MSKSIIQEKQFWADSLVPQFLKSQNLEDHLEKRRRIVKAFPLVYAAAFGIEGPFGVCPLCVLIYNALQ